MGGIGGWLLMRADVAATLGLILRVLFSAVVPLSSLRIWWEDMLWSEVGPLLKGCVRLETCSRKNISLIRIDELSLPRSYLYRSLFSLRPVSTWSIRLGCLVKFGTMDKTNWSVALALRFKSVREVYLECKSFLQGPTAICVYLCSHVCASCVSLNTGSPCSFRMVSIPLSLLSLGLLLYSLSKYKAERLHRKEAQEEMVSKEVELQEARSELSAYQQALKAKVGNHGSEIHFASRQVKDKQPSKPTSPECAICFEDMESGKCGKGGKKWLGYRSKTRRRAVFVPCGHACVCNLCANKIHKSTNQCPVCRSKLTKKPLTLPAVLHI